MTETTATVWLLIVEQAQRLRRVNVPVSTIVERTGLSLGQVEEELAALGNAGLVGCWSAGDDQDECATLLALAAAHLGLRLRRTSGGMRGLTWQPIDGRERCDQCGRPVGSNQCYCFRVRPSKTLPEADFGTSLDAMPGSEARPDQHAEAAEEVERSAPRQTRGRLSDAALDPARLPRPRVLLSGCQPWDDRPSTWHPPMVPCPACRGSKMRGTTYCLRCDRWGLDWLLGRIERDEARTAAENEKAKPQSRGLAERRAS